MNLKTGMIIDIENLNDLYSNVYINLADESVYNFKIHNYKLIKMKLGEYVVVYQNDNNADVDIKLLSELI